MSYVYKFIVILIVLAGAYTLFGISHFKWMHHSLQNPKADFQISGNEQADFTFIEFLNYECGYCKALHSTMRELQQVRKDIRFVIRPIAFDNEETGEKDMTTRIAMAAGLQGKFVEFDNDFLEYPESNIPDDFIREISDLYGINYAKLMDDANGKQVEKLIEENIAALDHAGIGSVPSFMIGDDFYIVGDEGLPDLKQLLTLISTQQ